MKIALYNYFGIKLNLMISIPVQEHTHYEHIFWVPSITHTQKNGKFMNKMLNREAIE